MSGVRRARSRAGAGARAGLVFGLVALLAACSSPAAPAPAEEKWFAGCAPAAGTGMELPCFTGGAATSVTGPAVVNLWASWCAPCRQELPAFQRLAESGKVTVLGVVTLDDRGRALDTAKDLGVRFPTLYDSAGRLQKSVGKSLLPVTLFVDAQGRVTHTYTGPALDDAALGTLVKEHL
ncbi:TlpA disulfide reductase family protein [Longispora sp. K20-0274]|uniref:TlpA family protein disulfide reductase n=1 Tax=Longispora sp. K20-0274 TaxID=3088255 RepID=UPI00399A5E81